MRPRLKTIILAVVLTLVLVTSALAATGNLPVADTGGDVNGPGAEATYWFGNFQNRVADETATAAGNQYRFGTGDCASCDQYKQQEQDRDRQNAADTGRESGSDFMGTMDPQNCPNNECEPVQERDQQRQMDGQYMDQYMGGGNMAQTGNPPATQPATPAPSSDTNDTSGCYTCGTGNTSTGGAGPAYGPPAGGSSGDMPGGMSGGMPGGMRKR